MTDFILVTLTGPAHPHAGEQGRVPVRDGKVTLEQPAGIYGPEMVRVELVNCPHGEQACYARQSEMRLARSGHE